MSFKYGHDRSDHFEFNLELVEHIEGEGDVAVSISGIKNEDGTTGYGYGATVVVERGRIVKFIIKSYDILVEIPATIEAHNAIQKVLSKQFSRT